jgi:hypothetical protein
MAEVTGRQTATAAGGLALLVLFASCASTLPRLRGMDFVGECLAAGVFIVFAFMSGYVMYCDDKDAEASRKAAESPKSS